MLISGIIRAGREASLFAIVTVGNSMNVREKRKSESSPLPPFPFRISFARYNPRMFHVVSKRAQSHFRIFIDDQILLSLFLVFFPLLPSLLTLFFSFVTRCPFAKRTASLHARQENLHVQMEKLGLTSTARIMRYHGFASERRKALISRKRRRRERETIGCLREIPGEKKTSRPGDECAPGRRSWGHRRRWGNRDGIAIIAMISRDQRRKGEIRNGGGKGVSDYRRRGESLRRAAKRRRTRGFNGGDVLFFILFFYKKKAFIQVQKDAWLKSRALCIKK